LTWKSGELSDGNQQKPGHMRPLPDPYPSYIRAEGNRPFLREGGESVAWEGSL
jgi:hypothetical protein